MHILPNSRMSIANPSAIKPSKVLEEEDTGDGDLETESMNNTDAPWCYTRVPLSQPILKKTPDHLGQTACDCFLDILLFY